MINNEKQTASFIEWVSELKKQNSFTSAIEFFVKSVDFPALYFEYQSPKDWLLLKHSRCISSMNPSVCLRLHESDPSYEPSKLYKPREIPIFHSQVQKLFGTDQYKCFPIVFNKEIIAVFSWVSDSSIITEKLFILHNHIRNFLWQEKWEKQNDHEEKTACLNGKYFLKKLFIEFSRARRLKLPVSLILLELDQMNILKSFYGAYKPEVFIKTLANNLIADSRAYDIFGLWPKQGRLGIILPHTTERGAGIKAEKIRWSVQSSDFSKVFPSHPRLTLSLSLGEYPRVSRSADSLFRAVLKALSFALGECGGNMTALATPVVGFKPDFATPKEINSLRDLT